VRIGGPFGVGGVVVEEEQLLPFIQVGTKLLVPIDDAEDDRVVYGRARRRQREPLEPLRL